MRYPKLKKKWGSPYWFRIYGGIKFGLLLEFFPVSLKMVMFFMALVMLNFIKTIWQHLGIIVVFFTFVSKEIGTFGGKYFRRNRVL